MLTICTVIFILSLIYFHPCRCHLGASGYVYSHPQHSLNLYGLSDTFNTPQPSQPLKSYQQLYGFENSYLKSLLPRSEALFNYPPNEGQIPSGSQEIQIPVKERQFMFENILSQFPKYIVNGRILKQYSVMEDIPDDVQQNILINTVPTVLDSYDRFLSQVARLSPQSVLRVKDSSISRPIIPPFTRSHGPIALGSGSLGYIRLPNGGIFLGSGSLGYISSQQRVDDATQARFGKQLTLPGPLSFGSASTDP